jgi:LacI family transcriptional regulator
MGRDVGVIGFTDIKVASILTPPLTTIHEPAEMIGKKAVECIVSEIEDGNAVRPQNIILGTELKVRESCGEKHISIARKKKSPKRVTSKITV